MCLLYTHVNIVNQSVTVNVCGIRDVYCDCNCEHELSLGPMAVA